ncbi:MAG: glycosyltransferase [Bacilli bacterium]
MNFDNLDRFEKSKTTRIEYSNINGIKNPLLHIKLKSFEIENNFIVLANGKVIQNTLYPLGSNENLVIEAKLPADKKNIVVLVENPKGIYIVCKMTNTKIGRVLSKSMVIFKYIRSKIITFFILIFRAIRFFWKQYHFFVPLKMWKKYFKDFVDRMKLNGNNNFYNPRYQSEYLRWLEEKDKHIKKYDELIYKPLISILIPVYNIDSNLLCECIDSILNQTYDNFEICLVDDCSQKIETLETLKEYEKRDKRIRVKYRTENGHISVATNDALSMAKGEFVGLVDDDDILDKDALYENVKALNNDNTIDMLYSDEDKLDLRGKRCDPHFKSDFSIDTLLSLNYICHFVVLRKSIMNKIGGFRIGLEGAQDFDLFLRFSEETKSIHHIPLILYHWRMVKGSTSMAIDNKSYALDKGKIAIEDALKRRNIKGNVVRDVVSTYYHIIYEYDEPIVSIIIPCKDHSDVTEVCLKSLFNKTTYKNYEVIIMNNESVEDKTYSLFDSYKDQYKNFKVIDANVPFNYSLINNMGIKECKGDVIVLLNNDTEIITPDWLSIMVGYAIQPHIGAVGAKLLYPDYTVQHAGVLLGLGGVASHAGIGSSRDDLGLYGRLRVPYNYSAVTAACLVVEKKKFNEVNGLEEKLEVAYNDVDFNLKLFKKGYYNICVPQVELIHHESKSRGLDTTSEKFQRFKIESEFMHSKWDYLLLNDPFYNINYSRNGFFVLDKEK